MIRTNRDGVHGVQGTDSSGKKGLRRGDEESGVGLGRERRIFLKPEIIGKWFP